MSKFLKITLVGLLALGAGLFIYQTVGSRNADASMLAAPADNETLLCQSVNKNMISLRLTLSRLNNELKALQAQLAIEEKKTPQDPNQIKFLKDRIASTEYVIKYTQEVVDNLIKTYEDLCLPKPSPTPTVTPKQSPAPSPSPTSSSTNSPTAQISPTIKP